MKEALTASAGSQEPELVEVTWVLVASEESGWSVGGVLAASRTKIAPREFPGSGSWELGSNIALDVSMSENVLPECHTFRGTVFPARLTPEPATFSVMTRGIVARRAPLSASTTTEAASSGRPSTSTRQASRGARDPGAYTMSSVFETLAMPEAVARARRAAPAASTMGRSVRRRGVKTKAPSSR